MELGTASVSQSESNPGVSNSLIIPAITDFDGLVEDDTFVNMYRVTGSFLESEADEGSSVTFDMTSDAYVTYWVSIYDANGVPRDVDSETDSSATYTERWTSLIYTGLSSYRHFTGQVRYHANYPSGYDPVHTVTVPCSTDTRANSGDSTPADSRYDSTGNRQIETTETRMLFKAPAGYRAVSTPITWQAFHGTNGTTSRSFSCYWYTKKWFCLQ